jgi:amidase
MNAPNADALLDLDAHDQVGALHRKMVSPAELTAAAIARAEKINPTINAIIHPRYERATQEAAVLSQGPITTPLHGVPVVVKDLEAPIAGEPHHMGSRVLKNVGFSSPHDSFIVRRLKQAGAVIIGRTNTPEFGSTVTTEPLAYGASRNPWNLEHSTGGSSGGSAAAVAARIVAVGHGNDGGGSIRVPASECGLVGLKPSRGRISKGPDIGESWMGATIDGVMTRSVRDTALMLDILSGYETGDPYTAVPFARPLMEELGKPVGFLRIGVLDHPLMQGGVDHPETRESIAKTRKLLESLGHIVEDAYPAAMGEEDFADTFTGIVAVATDAGLTTIEQLLGRSVTEDDIEADNLFMREIGRSITAANYVNMVNWMHAWSRRMLEWWHPVDGSRGFDILVTPTLAGPPPKLGWLSGPEGGLNLRAILQYTPQFNVTGQPAVSLPLHWSNDGLPMGVQFVASANREDLLIRLASQLEVARSWSDKVAPIT